MSAMNNTVVRAAVAEDCARVLELMRGLAAFEGYLDDFAVTEADLQELYVQQQHFGILVAEEDGRIGGILVYFFQPFTFDLTPWLIVKELYIDSAFRGHGLGEALMLEAKRVCKAAGGSKMKWEVLTENLPAMKFYKKLGAVCSEDWRTMSLPVR